MVQVIVERSFAEPAASTAIREIRDRAVRCAEMHHVRFVRTWFSKDRRRMICLYEAPDAESVRIGQRKAGIPFDRAWTAAHVPPPASPPATPLGFREHVVVERTFEARFTPEAFAARLEKTGECLPRHRVSYLGGYMASDGLRMVCIFVAPDAESVRIANREGGAPFDRAWTATLHEPAAPA